MTLNSKVLSLVLLTGLTMGGAFAKKQKATDWNNDSHSVKWSEEKCDAADVNKHCPKCDKPCTDLGGNTSTCCPDVCCSDLCAEGDCSKLLPCCTKCTQVLRFQGNLSFAQVVGPQSGTTGNACPRSTLEDPGMCGKIELAFDPAFTKLCWRITICGADQAVQSKPNAGITAAYLYFGDCNDALVGGNAIQIPINLWPAPRSPFTCGTQEKQECHSGSITMAELECYAKNAGGSCLSACQSIACLYQAAITNGLFLSVEGSSTCNSGGISYSRENGGVLRAMILPCLPACAK